VVLYFTPHLLDINQGLPPCAPCDRATVPWFDRWVIAEPREAWAVGSTLLVVGIGVLAGWDLLDNGTRRTGDVAALTQSAAIAAGVTELVKAIAARNRPVLYTAGASEAAAALDAQRSWPSGHTAVAFALATSYALSVSREGGPAWRRWAAWIAAAGVGSLRIAAARHFPSDVLAGAAVGALSAVGTHVIRF
jgi:membrane-associated phospholipid phosphatase